MIHFRVPILCLIFLLGMINADEILEESPPSTDEPDINQGGIFCADDKIIFELRTKEEFSGVIYTQGSFHSREEPCFIDPICGKRFVMEIPFDKCGTMQYEEKYSNVIVVQNDDELITPYDTAFFVKCDLSKWVDFEIPAGSYYRENNSTVKATIYIMNVPDRERR